MSSSGSLSVDSNMLMITAGQRAPLRGYNEMTKKDNRDDSFL